MAKSIAVDKKTGSVDSPTNPERLAHQNRNPGSSLSKALLIVGWIGMLIFACHASTHMVAAGDTWVAMACGRHFINHGVDTVEPFSANSHHAGPTEEEVKTWPHWAQAITKTVGLDTVKKWHPTGWVNQNWLTHVIFYWLSTTLGSKEKPYFDALVFWKFALYIVSALCIYVIARLQHVRPLLAAGASSFALFVGRSFLDVRPAGFSNLLVPVFILILVLTYRKAVYIWLIVPLAVFWCNVHGGYLYIFIMLVPFFVLNLLAQPFKEHFETISKSALKHTVGAGLTAFVAMIIFNPFHLTNLTHTYIISLSKNAERWREVHEWHPAFEWSNPVGTAVPYLILFIVSIAVLIAWPIVQAKTASMVFSENPKLRRKLANGTGYTWPKLNPALLAIAALTIYMAYRSRRFIPIAAFAACPFVAALLQEIVDSIRTVVHYQRTRQLTCPAVSRRLQWTALVLCGGFLLGFGSWAAVKYKRVYLDPWPADPQYHSVFMRMTASFLKPFQACEFIRENKLSGKMMNYWTEGGFIAYGQDPDPKTGKTPLQLFMDGRAQAAYTCDTFDTWNKIWSGGDLWAMIHYQNKMQKREITQKDYKRVGEWIDGELKKRNVWAALVPQGQYRRPFCRGLEELPMTWVKVFFNNKQKLFVDVTTEKGKALFLGIPTGQTRYPDEFTRDLNLAHYYLMYDVNEGARQKGLDYAMAAYKLNPSEAPLLEILTVAALHQELWNQITDFCTQILADFDAHKAEYVKEDGYRRYFNDARLACFHLNAMAKARGDLEKAAHYADKAHSYEDELVKQTEVSRW